MAGIELTDADQAAILEASGYVETTKAGDELFGAIYRAGLTAGRALGIEEAAKVCETLPVVSPDHGVTFGNSPDKYECAAAIRGLLK
jgi:hypothetical protein